jgi:diaminopimelate decarboxylase
VPKKTVYATNPDGVMELAGHDIRELIQRFGSPLLVLLEDVVRANCRAYREGTRATADMPEGRVYYASKALLTTGLCLLIEEEGLGLDVVSWGELQTALAAGFPADRILMHGNAKTEQDLRLALESGVGRIVIDNLDEIERLAQLTAEMQRTAAVMLRVTPGVKPSTHQYIQTGQQDSKFGFNLNGGAAEEAARRVVAQENLELVGLHCHIGSQIFEFEPFARAAEVMMGFYQHVRNDLGAPLSELNLGGGFGIGYGVDEEAPSIADYLTRLRHHVAQLARQHGVPCPVVCDEPGRSVVGPAGITLYEVESTKPIPDVRNYASVAGGMTDNPRYALYQARHHVLAATRMAEPAEELWSVAGRCCESGDMLIHDALLPPVRPGDVLAFFDTGAYTYSMASNYNRVAKPAIVLVAPGRADLLARRETAEDLLRLDCVPAWLAQTKQ